MDLTWGGLLRKAFAAKWSDVLLPGDVQGTATMLYFLWGAEDTLQSREASVGKDRPAWPFACGFSGFWIFGLLSEIVAAIVFDF